MRTLGKEATEPVGVGPEPVRRRRRPPRALLGAIAIVVAIAAALVVPRLAGDVVPGGLPTPPPTPAEPEPTGAPPPLPALAPAPPPPPPGMVASPAPPVPVVFPGFWPAHTLEGAEDLQRQVGAGSEQRWDDPLWVADTFAKGYVGWSQITDVRVVSREGSSSTGWKAVVSFRPMIGEGRLIAGSRHTLGLVGLGGAENPAWLVAWMRAEEIQVDVPSEGGPVGAMLDIQGKGRAYEGTIGVSIRDDAGTDLHADPGYVMGGGTELAPFAGRVSYARPATTGGILVLSDEGGLGGAPVTMSIVRVVFLDA